MTDSIRIFPLLAAMLMLSAPAAGAQTDGRCIIMVDRFEDQTDLPQFVPVFDQVVAVDNLLSVDLATSSPVAQDGLAFQLIDQPAGMTIDPSSGVVSWVPDETQHGLLSVTVAVTDTNQRRNRHIFCVSVNGPPTLIAPGNRLAETDAALSMRLFAVDPDPDDVLTFELPSAPADMQIDPQSGQIQWTPDSEGRFDVTARVTDSLNQFDTADFQIEVIAPLPDASTNAAPSLTVPDNQVLRFTETLSVVAQATDPDPGDVLTLGFVNAPADMTINPDSGAIDWSPAEANIGAFDVAVEVRDQFGSAAFGSFIVQVLDINRAPLALDDSFDAQRGITLSVPAGGVLSNDSDPNGDALTAALVDNPDFGDLSLDPNGSFDYAPDNPVGTIAAVQTLRYAPGSSGVKQPLLMDMDGNGIPDIVYHTFAELGAVQGDSHDEVFEIKLDRSLGDDKAIADIDLDGRMEIVLIGAENGRSGTQYGKKMIALEHDGQLKWISEALPQNFYREGSLQGGSGFKNARVTIADLDQDGTPEILVGWGRNGVGYSVFDNQGMLLETIEVEGLKSSGQNANTEVVDLDLDGDPEIVIGSAAFSHDGELLWSRNDIKSNSVGYHNPIAVNLDGDPYPELVRRTITGFGSRANTIVAWNHDGTDLWETDVPYVVGGGGIPLVIADVNSDGVTDILSASGSVSSVTAVNGSDGAILWSVEVPSNNRFSAATVLDLDRDGFNEVVYPYGINPTKLLILDGRDGSLKLEQEIFNGNFSSSIPIFADIDADGASELILLGHQVFSGNSPAFYIYESENDDWPPNRGVWNQWNYHVTNINEDGSVPQFEQPHWLLPGLNSNRVNERLPEEREENFDQFTYAASDGDLNDQATVYLRVLTNSNPPQFLSQPDTTGTINFDYRYAPIVTDPDPGESLTFELTSAPLGMTIDAVTGLLRWRPEATGEFNLGVAVTDSANLNAVQTWTLIVGEPVEVPTVIGLTEAAATSALTNADLSVGLVREGFSTAFPIGQIADQSPIAGSIAKFGAAVNLSVSLGPSQEDTDNDSDSFTESQGDCNDDDDTIFPGAPDPEGDGIDQNCDGFDGVLVLTSIELSPSESIVLSNRIINYQAVGIQADGTAVNLNGLGLFDSSDTNVAQLLGERRVRSAVPGTAAISLSYEGVVGEAIVSVVAGASLDNEPPLAEISSPISADKVTRPIEVIGTADDPNLLRWELLTTAGEDGEARLLNQSTLAVNDGVLGELDPTLLLNGVQTLILRVFDRGENVSEARVNITVEEDYKVGNFTLAFEDLKVNLASLPITVNRTYDSREKRRGDFGIGWNLGLRTVEVRTNRVLGTGWEVLGGGFSFQLNSSDDHLVTVTLPDGEVETFELTITPNSSFLVPFSFVTASLEPVGDTLGELTLLDNPFLVIVDGQPGPVQLLDDGSFDVFNPDRFRYVARSGLEFVVSQTDGLESFSDTNGNSLTFSDNAINHSNGTEVQFLRDGLGRITRLTDPTGQHQFYQYDSNGNLASHTDAVGNLTRFRYNRRNNLLEVIDPRGNRAVRNEYDDDGRLIAIVDAQDHRIEFTHNIAGREQLIRDANGNVQRLLLDDHGNVLVRERTVTIDSVPSVAVEQFEYDERGNMLVEINPDGIRTELRWDDDDNLLETVIDPGGLNLTTSSTYDERNNRLTETDALGRVTSYTYDIDDNVLTITDPLGGVTRFGYTGPGELATLTDPLGTATLYLYDADGQLIQEDMTDANGQLLSRKTYTFDASARRLSESVHRMINGALTPLTTSYEYDNNGRQTRMINPLGNVVQTEYDEAGNVSAQIDALGRRTEHSYDSRGQRVQTMYPDGTRIRMSYDPAGNMISEIDEMGRVRTYEYDELNRQIAVVHPDGAREEEVLSEGGQTIATIDANGNRTDFTYDAAGRQIATIAPEVVDARVGSLTRPIVTQSYDPTGRVISNIDANGHTTTFSYDELGRLVRTDHPDGSFTTQGFDAAGRVTSTTDELGRTIDYVYDGRGQLLRVTEPAPELGQPRPVTTYTWDLTGNRLTQTDALGRTTRMRYDVVNRQISQSLPGGQFTTAEYDATGNLVVQTDFNGQSVEFVYDERNRLIERSLPDGEVHGFTYSPTGARLSASDANGIQTFSYDLRDRLTGLTQADGSALIYQFDLVGNLVQTATASQTTDYNYDALNRMLTSTTGAEQTEYGYDPNGNQVILTRPNLAVTENTFDSRNRMLNIEHKDTADMVLESFANSYRANGQRETVTEFDGSVETYVYDDLDRLVSETRVGTNPRTIEYQYDFVGNRIEINQDGLIRSATYDQNDRLLSEGSKRFTYDANGNRTSVNDNGTIELLNWNALNWLTSVEQETSTTTFRYNVDGERIALDRDSNVEHYLIDPQNTTGFSQVKETRNAQGDLLEQFRYGNDLISRDDANEGLSYFHTDALGSTRLLTDDTTQATDRYAYTGYGVLTSRGGSSDNAYLYAGERLEDDTGNYDLRARFYDPAGGRFISRDPFRGMVEQPILLHPYLYGSVDPINNIDPMGLFTIMDVVQSLQIIATNIAIRYPQVCTALGAAEKVATAASLIGIGVTMAMQPPAPSIGKYSFPINVPDTFSPLEKIVYDYSGSRSSKDYKFTFEFDKSSNSSKIAGGVSINSQGIASFTGEFSSSLDYELAKLDFCGVDLAMLNAKIETADRAGFGSGSDFSGFNALGRTFGGNTEAKGFLELQAGPIVLEATLFTLRIGGGNAGFHPGGIN